MRCLQLAGLLALAVAAPACAEPTRVMVRVVTHDAKIIGDAAGGVHVSIREAESGRVLAEGLQKGGTGDTDAIMVEPRRRGEPVYDSEGAAGFAAELDLERPTRVEIRARGPLAPEHAALEARMQTWLLPGQHVEGDGFVLTLYGYAVQIREPQVRRGELQLQAHVAMLCTCPLTPGGLWDADEVQVQARLRDATGAVLAEGALAHAGEPSLFGGTLRLPDGDGPWTLEVTAGNAARATFGRHATTVAR